MKVFIVLVFPILIQNKGCFFDSNWVKKISQISSRITTELTKGTGMGIPSIPVLLLSSSVQYKILVYGYILVSSILIFSKSSEKTEENNEIKVKVRKFV